MTKTERDVALNELEALLKSWVSRREQELERERQFLVLVLGKHGFVSAGRRTANMSRLHALASVKTLLTGGV